MNSKVGVVGEILRHINGGKINLIICSSRFKNKYHDAVEFHESAKKVLWVEFDAKDGTKNVEKYDTIFKKNAILINDFPEGDQRSEFDDAAKIAMSIHEIRIVDEIYIPSKS